MKNRDLWRRINLRKNFILRTFLSLSGKFFSTLHLVSSGMRRVIAAVSLLALLALPFPPGFHSFVSVVTGKWGPRSGRQEKEEEEEQLRFHTPHVSLARSPLLFSFFMAAASFLPARLLPQSCHNSMTMCLRPMSNRERNDASPPTLN